MFEFALGAGFGDDGMFGDGAGLEDGDLLLNSARG
jgi:hypothetical protein